MIPRLDVAVGLHSDLGFAALLPAPVSTVAIQDPGLEKRVSLWKHGSVNCIREHSGAFKPELGARNEL